LFFVPSPSLSLSLSLSLPSLFFHLL
jgi:hypothetical protein